MTLSLTDFLLLVLIVLQVTHLNLITRTSRRR